MVGEIGSPTSSRGTGSKGAFIVPAGCKSVLLFPNDGTASNAEEEGKLSFRPGVLS